MDDTEEEEEERIQRLKREILNLDEGPIDKKSTHKFLFGISLHLGFCSNNYAEYAAVILAELFGALLN